jgi:hypothetical protein
MTPVVLRLLLLAATLAAGISSASAATSTASGATRPALRDAASERKLLTLLVDDRRRPGGAAERTLTLPAGRAVRRFTLREPAGVIVLSRLTVPHGVRAYVDATIPNIAGTRFSTARPHDPALVCRRRGSFDECTQSQEWCPMPAAVWRLHLVKQGGPAGPIRIDYRVGPPPETG